MGEGVRSPLQKTGINMAKLIPVCDGTVTLSGQTITCTGTLEVVDFQDYMSVGGPISVEDNIEVAWMVVLVLISAYCIKILKRGV